MVQNKQLIYKDDARRAVLKTNPSIAYCIDNVKSVDGLYTLEEIAKKICSSYEECVEGECPGFDYCYNGHNGVVAWLQKVVEGR